jgi:hypothetical protein
MTITVRPRRDPAGGRSATAASTDPVDVRAIRAHFMFPGLGRIVTNNAASTRRGKPLP